MVKNVSYTGDLIGMLASLTARALPTILTGLTTGLLSGTGDGLFLHKHGKYYRVQKCKSDGLYHMYITQMLVSLSSALPVKQYG